MGEFMKQNKKVLASPPDSIHRNEDEVASNSLSSSNEEEPLRRTEGGQRKPINSMILELKYWI